MIGVVAKELDYSLFRIAFRLDIGGGYQRSIYVFGRNIDERTWMGELRVRFAGYERFADSKG